MPPWSVPSTAITVAEEPSQLLVGKLNCCVLPQFEPRPMDLPLTKRL